jgi:hypothetical protein
MKILCLILMALFVSCGKKAPNDGGGSSLSASGQLLLTTLPQSHPNQYFVSVDWNAVEAGRELTLNRQRKGERKTLCDLSRCPKPYLDSGTLAGEEFTYSIEDDSGPVAEKNVLIPKDYVMEGTRNLDTLPPLSEFRRLFLKKGARILTRGDFTLFVEELVADEAVIETFPENEAARQGVGRAAGTLRLWARTASGSLQVISRGEKGAKGETGLAGATGNMGFRGPQGEEDDCHTHPEITPGGEKLCEMYLHLPLPPTHPGWRNGYACRTKNLDGLEGGMGGKGYPGGQGAAGGPAGAVHVEVENPSSFKLDVLQIGGAGGDGGDGGPGGEGGPGGAPGELDLHQLCTPGKQGPQGATGPQGPTGPAGTAGSKEAPKCIRLGSSTEGSCV